MLGAGHVCRVILRHCDFELILYKSFIADAILQVPSRVRVQGAEMCLECPWELPNHATAMQGASSGKRSSGLCRAQALVTHLGVQKVQLPKLSQA